MELKEFSEYLKRPLASFESVQKNNFKRLVDIVGSKKESYNSLYDLEVVGFLNPHTRAHTKEIIESNNLGYSLFLLFDLPLRKTDLVINCLIPTNLATRWDIHNTYNTCIQFRKFKKIIVVRKGIEDYVAEYQVVIVDDFEIVNPIKLRTTSAKESREAQKIREEILFDELHIEMPSNVKLSIFNSLFLSPKLKSRSGIETKSLIKNSATGRILINLDRYNKILTGLIPPEVSNCHYPYYRSDVVTYEVPNLGEKIDVHIKFPMQGYYFNAACTPTQKEDENINLRSLTNNEIGINHQTKFFNYSTKKDLIEKFIATEFYYKQDYVPEHKIIDTRRSQSMIEDNEGLLYNDYVSRIFKQLPAPSSSVGEDHKIQNLAKDYAEEIGWRIRQGSDAYFNNIVRSIAENLYRVKSILHRSGFMAANLGLEYLESLQLNFDEIKETPDYKNIPKKDIDVEKITKIMNNPIRTIIINSLKIRDNNAMEEDIFNEFVGLGHKVVDIVKELRRLEEGGIICKVGSIYHICDKEI
ncbi:hypothetical protein HYX04_03885 [Candidatus Woesearchaeota archaeon]|nr:hypothetical protein [Candidatus Woesearchaeota archaeon]